MENAIREKMSDFSLADGPNRLRKLVHNSADRQKYFAVLRWCFLKQDEKEAVLDSKIFKDYIPTNRTLCRPFDRWPNTAKSFYNYCRRDLELSSIKATFLVRRVDSAARPMLARMKPKKQQI